MSDARRAFSISLCVRGRGRERKQKTYLDSVKMFGKAPVSIGRCHDRPAAAAQSTLFQPLPSSSSQITLAGLVILEAHSSR